MKIKPLNDRIIVKRTEAKTTTAGGIIIPDANTEKQVQGEVVAVGRGYRNEDGSHNDLTVKPGDKVIFNKYSGSEIKVDGEELIIMQESEVLGIIQ